MVFHSGFDHRSGYLYFNVERINESNQMDLVSKDPNLTWQNRCRATAKIHKDYLRMDNKWGVRDTARELNRSISRISDDITIAKWLEDKEFGVRIMKMGSIDEALKFIRAKKLEAKLA